MADSGQQDLEEMLKIVVNKYATAKVVVNPEITQKVQAAESAAIAKYLQCVCCFTWPVVCVVNEWNFIFSNITPPPHLQAAYPKSKMFNQLFAFLGSLISKKRSRRRPLPSKRMLDLLLQRKELLL